MCLAPGLYGFNAQLQLSLYGPGGLCGPIQPASVRLDDVRVEPDPSCP